MVFATGFAAKEVGHSQVGIEQRKKGCKSKLQNNKLPVVHVHLDMFVEEVRTDPRVVWIEFLVGVGSVVPGDIFCCEKSEGTQASCNRRVPVSEVMIYLPTKTKRVRTRLM